MTVPKTFTKFLEMIGQYDVGEIGDVLKGSQEASGVLKGYLHHYDKLMPAVYLLDYTQRKYLYASSNMRLFVDYPLSRFLDGGLNFGWEIFHKDDLKVYGENVLFENLKFIKDIPVTSHGDYLFTCNYRVKNRKGVYKQIRQQSIFIKSTANGMPLATLGFLYDVSAYARSNKIIHTIEDTKPQAGVHNLHLNNVYFPDEKDRLLSSREIEILKWVCEGLTSKQISDKLHRSLHTINAHRRNIIDKTNSKSVVELMKYAINQDYL